MRESLGITKPKGVAKVKVWLVQTEVRSCRFLRGTTKHRAIGASPARPMTIVLEQYPVEAEHERTC